MNAPPSIELRPLSDGAADDKMYQVRDLLIGDYVRSNEQRMAALESRIAELEASVTDRVAALGRQVMALGADTTADRRAAFEELARGIAELGEKIKVIAR